ncbi:MAG TPA: 4Fe-4S binding protein [Desulfatiglandales bacterium]|nr:4Fe-4S binding protein [Desulfatiglandales bacterium]
MKLISKFEGPWSTPEEPLDVKTGEWRTQRPVVKREKCRQCGWCFIYCPAGCIEEKGHYFSADLDYCKGCGICARVCPAMAVVLVREEV